MRSFDSPILKWPQRNEVHRAITAWAAMESERRPELLRVGYIGSYAQGNWGVGSDLDVILVVSEASKPWISRATEWDLSSLPVPVDLLVYTRSEFERKLAEPTHFSRELQRAVWVHSRDIQ